jgi:phosphatidylglycerophosphatase C
VTASFQPAVVAAFDVDGTLTTRDCVLPFLRRVTGAGFALACLRRPVMTVRALLAGDRDTLKALACSALAGMTAGALQREGAAFAREVCARRLRSDTVGRLEHHRLAGHRVVLVSASLEPYLLPLGSALGVDGVVCTRLEVDAGGTCTGRLAGPNCRGAEKVRRLRGWLAEQGLTEAVVWAYGDSAGDAELLAAADHAVWVRGVVIRAEP